MTTAASPTSLIHNSAGQEFQQGNILFDMNSTSIHSTVFQVDEEPRVIKCHNLIDGDELTVEFVSGKDTDRKIDPLCLIDGPIVLNQKHNYIRLDLPGFYRVTYTGTNTLGHFTVIQFPGSLSHESVMGLYESLRIISQNLQINIQGDDPVVVDGSGTTADPYEISVNQADNLQEENGLPAQYLINAGTLKHIVGSTTLFEDAWVGVNTGSGNENTFAGFGAGRFIVGSSNGFFGWRSGNSTNGAITAAGETFIVGANTPQQASASNMQIDSTFIAGTALTYDTQINASICIGNYDSVHASPNLISNSVVIGHGAGSINLTGTGGINATLIGNKCGHGLPTLENSTVLLAQPQGTAFGWASVPGNYGLSAGYETFDRSSHGVTLGDRAGCASNFNNSGNPFGPIRIGSGSGIANAGNRAISIGYYSGAYNDKDDNINIGTRSGSNPPSGATQIGGTLANTAFNDNGTTITSITVTGHGVSGTITALILAQSDPGHPNLRGPLFSQDNVIIANGNPIIVKLTATDANTLTFSASPNKYIKTDTGFQFTLWNVTGLTLSYANTICIGTDTLATQANQVVLGNSATTQLVTAGSIISGGTVVPSDERLKTSITPYHNGLDVLNKLDIVTYQMNENAYKGAGMPYLVSDIGKTHCGAIAQQFEKALPDLIEHINNRFGDYKAIRWERLMPYCVSAIQQLSNKNKDIDGLYGQIKSLNEKVDKLSKKQKSPSHATGESP